MIRTVLFASALLATPAMAATAKLADATGKSIGSAKVAQSSHGIRLTVKVKGLEPGERGLHLHTVGLCEAPKFTTAGPHWNPGGKQHGRDNPMGSHAGDLPNLVIDAKGRGSLAFDVHGAELAALMDSDGAALVIHAKPDDYKTDPTGASGDRVVCGVFK
jgi:superoxide dismutase, Cu-Zn family